MIKSERTVFVCSKCGAIFFDEISCVRHEEQCNTSLTKSFDTHILPTFEPGHPCNTCPNNKHDGKPLICGCTLPLIWNEQHGTPAIKYTFKSEWIH